MPIALSLLFIAIPVVAALSFEIDMFVALFILFCVIAGLSVSNQDGDVSAEEAQARQELWKALKADRALRQRNG